MASNSAEYKHRRVIGLELLHKLRIGVMDDGGRAGMTPAWPLNLLRAIPWSHIRDSAGLDMFSPVRAQILRQAGPDLRRNRAASPQE